MYSVLNAPIQLQRYWWTITYGSSIMSSIRAGNSFFLTVYESPAYVPNSKSKPDGIVPFNAPKLDTPEALNAWIQARKKNWPSKANVERKEQEKKKRQLDRTDKARQEPKEKKQKTTEDSKTIVGDYGSSSEGEEDDESKVRDNSIASDEEGDDIMDPDRDAVTSKDPKAMGRVGSPPPTRPRKLCKYFMSKRGCLHGDKCTFSHERPPRPEPRQKKPPVTKTRSNLLRKVIMVSFYYLVGGTHSHFPICLVTRKRD